MLKYLIGFSLISFCYSVPGISYNWNVVILYQHSPVTSFFAQQERDVNTNDADFLQYIADHWTKYQDSWIINRLWAFNQDGEHMDDCTDRYGGKLTYTGMGMHPRTKEIFRTIWPSVKPNLPDEEVWAQDFNTTGSCVAPEEFYYFGIARILFFKKDIGESLSQNGIHSGRSYSYDHIVDTIGRILGKRFHINCLTTRNSETQYLLEVGLCFDHNKNLVNCFPRQQTRNIFACDPNRDIFYPEFPRI